MPRLPARKQACVHSARCSCCYSRTSACAAQALVKLCLRCVLISHYCFRVRSTAIHTEGAPRRIGEKCAPIWCPSICATYATDRTAMMLSSSLPRLFCALVHKVLCRSVLRDSFHTHHQNQAGKTAEGYPTTRVSAHAFTTSVDTQASIPLTVNRVELSNYFLDRKGTAHGTGHQLSPSAENS